LWKLYPLRDHGSFFLAHPCSPFPKPSTPKIYRAARRCCPAVLSTKRPRQRFFYIYRHSKLELMGKAFTEGAKVLVLAASCVETAHIMPQLEIPATAYRQSPTPAAMLGKI